MIDQCPGNFTLKPKLIFFFSEQVLECETEKGQGIEEDEECEDISSSSQEYEDAAFREEKALSDSELKVEVNFQV